MLQRSVETFLLLGYRAGMFGIDGNLGASPLGRMIINCVIRLCGKSEFGGIVWTVMKRVPLWMVAVVMLMLALDSGSNCEANWTRNYSHVGTALIARLLPFKTAVALLSLCLFASANLVLYD